MMKTFIILTILIFLSQKAISQNNPYQQVDSLMRAYIKPVKDIDDLREVWYFIYQNVYTDSLRLRAVVVWIAENIAYDVKGWQNENPDAGELAYVLRRKKAVCAGYASLLKYMCDMFKIDCQVVSGRARAFDRDVYLSQSKLTENHAWNMVRINDKWRLIDPTWVSGSVTGDVDEPKTHFIKEFNETYYFTPPDKFILNHFPKQSQYQLLSPFVKEDDFRRSPLFVEDFLKSDIRSVSPNEALIKAAVGDTIVFRLKTNDLISEITAWSLSQKKADYKNEVEKNGEFIEFSYPVTVVGSYNLYLSNTNTLRSKTLLGYKLQVEPKRTR